MEEKLNQAQQQVAEEKKLRPTPILDAELLKALRANTKAIEALSSNITVLEFRLREIFHLENTVG